MFTLCCFDQKIGTAFNGSFSFTKIRFGHKTAVSTPGSNCELPFFPELLFKMEDLSHIQELFVPVDQCFSAYLRLLF